MEKNRKDNRTNNMHIQLAQLPSVEEVLQQEELRLLSGRYSRRMITPLVREVLAEERKRIRAGALPPTIFDIIKSCTTLIEQEYQSLIKPVINGTGVVLHTNLGRAALGQTLFDDALPALTGFNNLEYNLWDGQRGKRGEFVEKMLSVFSGAENALILNNNAAAVFLILKVLAKDKEVIISRGELVQIGGGFRIPDILRESGAILREVGTTNQTTITDYHDAITENTGLILKVHQSNFALEGFTRSVDIKELKILGKKYKLPVVADLGSGAFLQTEQFALAHEPMVQEMVRSDADLVCFSTDKLLGGPQGGIICGKSEYINLIRKDPLYRTFRVGKLTLCLLQSTILYYLQERAIEDLPLWRMISVPAEDIKKRCMRLARSLKKRGIPAYISEGVSLIGGGSLPGKTLPTYLLGLKIEKDVAELDKRLRLSDPAVLGRVKDGHLFFDPRTIEPHYDKKLVELIQSAFYQKYNEEEVR